METSGWSDVGSDRSVTTKGTGKSITWGVFGRAVLKAYYIFIIICISTVLKAYIHSSFKIPFLHESSFSIGIKGKQLNAVLQRYGRLNWRNRWERTPLMNREIGGEGFDDFGEHDIEELLVDEALNDDDILESMVDTTKDFETVCVDSELEDVTPLDEKLLREGLQLSAPAHFDPNLDCEISLTEFSTEISKLRNNRETELDNIPNEATKDLPDEYLKLLTNTYHKILMTSSVPSMWTRAIIHPIFKNGDPNKP
ncbi:hypothetical protein LAZ67_X001857 [Cordylochernes scorpioides]|uniref:Uncharacterized protein n=1 Tax=Cordylochernes scorpioides TaxID=51811 RepID=A0ABY6LSU8_9ARAC|nr:hypothetical protein LAZ67_X001857 [Cordylochernes scorpioides]